MKINKTKKPSVTKEEQELFYDKQVLLNINKTLSKSDLSEEIEIAHEYLDELGLSRKDDKNVYYDLPNRIKLLIKSK